MLINRIFKIKKKTHWLKTNHDTKFPKRKKKEKNHYQEKKSCN